MAQMGGDEAVAKESLEKKASEVQPRPLTMTVLEEALLREHHKIREGGKKHEDDWEELLMASLRSAEKLDLSGMSLSSVEKLDSAESLKVLYLHGNCIEKLGSGLMDLRCLQVLSLAHNAIRSIEFGDLCHCVSLTLLDLDYNLLQAVPPARVLPRKLRCLSYRQNPCTKHWKNDDDVLSQAASYASELPRLRKLNGVMLPLTFTQRKGETYGTPSQQRGDSSEASTARAVIKKCVGGKVSTRGGSPDLCCFNLQLSVVLCDLASSATRIITLSFSDADDIWEMANEICCKEALRVPDDLDTLYEAMLNALQRCHSRHLQWERSRRSAAHAYLVASGQRGQANEAADGDSASVAKKGNLLGPSPAEVDKVDGKPFRFTALAKREGLRIDEECLKLAEEDPVDFRLQRAESTDGKRREAQLAYDRLRETGIAEARKSLRERKQALDRANGITEGAKEDKSGAGKSVADQGAK